MAQMIGADPEQLDALGNQMSGCADRLDSIRGEITSLLSHSHWEGRDANDFRGAWHGHLSGLLTAAAHATRDGASALHTNATQQRGASSSDGGIAGLAGVPGGFGTGSGGSAAIENFLSLYDGAGWGMTLLSALGGVSSSMAYIASGKMTGPLGRALAEKINALPQPLKTVVVKEAPELKGFTKIAEGAGKALGYFGLGVDSFELGMNLAKDPGSEETIHSGVDVAFDAAEILTMECPPLSLGIFAAHTAVDLTWDYLDEHPEVGKAIGDGVSNAARTVADAAGTAFDAGVHVAGGVANVVEGGVNGIKGFFHL